MEYVKSFFERILELLKIYYLEVIAFSAVLLHLIPYYIFGQNSVIGIHDTFDSNFVWYKVLADSGMMFADSSDIVPLIMDGLPRISFGSEFNVLIWLFYFFEPFTAYVINLTAMHLVGFVGMFLLLNRHFLKEEKHRILVLGIAVCFAILPLWPPAGLSVASLPLALYAFMNIRSKQATKVDLLILFLIPFYSSIIYSFLFFLSMIGVLWLYDFIRTRDFGLHFFAAGTLMAFEFLLIEYRLVMGILFGEGLVSHRVEFKISDLNLMESLTKGLKNFILGQYHVGTLQGLVILFAIILSFIILFSSRFEVIKKPVLGLGLCGVVAIFVTLLLFGYTIPANLIYLLANYILLGSFYPYSLIGAIGLTVVLIVMFIILVKRSERLRLIIQENSAILGKMILLLGLCAVFSFWYGLWSSEMFLPWKQQFTILRTIQLSRFHWIHPLLWYLLFALSLSVISSGIDFKFKSVAFGKLIAVLLILLQLSILMPYGWTTASMSYGGHESVTFNQFYAEGIFQDIEDDIGLSQDSYRVVSIGLHPAISQYNGFYTLDGYFNNYPLEYKYQFRNIISYELTKNDNLRKYFDEWGSRCYVLVDELDRNFYCTKNDNIVINNLQLNTTALYEMSCSYIFSAVNISNYLDNSLQLNGIYEHNDSVWRIYLYEVL